MNRNTDLQLSAVTKSLRADGKIEIANLVELMGPAYINSVADPIDYRELFLLAFSALRYIVESADTDAVSKQQAGTAVVAISRLLDASYHKQEPSA